MEQWIRAANHFIVYDYSVENVKTEVAVFLDICESKDLAYAIKVLRQHDLLDETYQLLCEMYGSLDSKVIKIKEVINEQSV